MRIRPFGVEIWMNEYETQCEWNLAETCVASLSVSELLDLAGASADELEQMRSLRLTYGAIEGTERLRAAIAALYDTQEARNVLVAHGAIGANALLYATLVEPGDRVISVQPTYQQHYSIPESYGADVRILRLRKENGFLPDLDELRQLATRGTKLIAINNPNNPTGALMDRAMLEAIAAIAREQDAWVLCDEVYRGLDQEGSGTTASMADLYERGISTGSMSKAFSLAGLRLGWIVGPRALLDAVSVHRDYNTISVGVLDDHLAALALEHADAVLARSRDITRTNLAILEAWMATQSALDWVKPRSGTTALLELKSDEPSRDFCVRLLEETGVMLTPGSVMEMEGWLRIGYANATHVLEAGLERMGAFMFAQISGGSRPSR
ncbi:MAG: aminotransferase [Acidobacteria bacterium]|nr:aminotransferase [Acidobacteriota bacterium]